MLVTSQQVYRDPAVVSSYARADYLEPAERALMDLLQEQHPGFRMLDIAVGGGRTTHYFAPLASEYVGIDYSPEMIAACHKRFGTRHSNAHFQVSDMRNLDWLPDQSFDFILISYNAISALQHHERLKVFQELWRICSYGGYFYFSAHNLFSLHRLFSFSDLLKRLSWMHPRHSYWDLRRWWLRKIIYNPLLTYPRVMRAQFAMINDGAENFRLQMYYVKPAEQVEQLSQYFSKVQVFSRAGNEIQDRTVLETIDDDWLFYLAVK